jgi:hypothetical protein
MGKRREPPDWQGEAERLREALIRIEAFADAARERLDVLPYLSSIQERAKLQRLVVFVEELAATASNTPKP